MSTDPVILSPEQSRRLRELQRKLGFHSFDALIEEMIFFSDPANRNEPRKFKKTPSKLLNKSQLAAALGRSNSYVSAMCRSGFEVPCGRTTLKAALKWMAQNPGFRQTDVYSRS